MNKSPLSDLDEKSHSQAVRRGYADARDYLHEYGVVKFETELRRKQGYLNFLTFIQTYTATCFHT